jgi:hypothetical protein
MAKKEMYVEILKPCWMNGAQHGAGSIALVSESDGLMAIGLKKAKKSDAKAEKYVPFGKKVAAPAPEKK